METRNEWEKTKQGLFEDHEQEETIKKLKNKDDDADGGINKKIMDPYDFDEIPDSNNCDMARKLVEIHNSFLESINVYRIMVR